MRRFLPAVVLMSLLSVGSLFASEPGKDVDDQTKSRVRAEIERYVSDEVRLKRHFFLVDPRSDRTLRLSFDHVHDGVSPSPKGYGACVDFKDKAGKVYDVDFFVSLGDAEARVEEVVLHKVDGKPLPGPKEKGK